jgi:hypothetical protein
LCASAVALRSDFTHTYTAHVARSDRNVPLSHTSYFAPRRTLQATVRSCTSHKLTRPITYHLQNKFIHYHSPAHTAEPLSSLTTFPVSAPKRAPPKTLFARPSDTIFLYARLALSAVGTLFADRARGRIGAFWVMAANLRLCFLQRLGCIRSVLRRNVLGMGMEFIWKKRQKVKTECGNVVQIVENKKNRRIVGCAGWVSRFFISRTH